MSDGSAQISFVTSSGYTVADHVGAIFPVVTRSVQQANLAMKGIADSRDKIYEFFSK